ncbi:MAG: hypothetical protein ACP5NL_07275 [Thermoplasmata archaeon]
MSNISNSKLSPYEKLLLILPGFKGYKNRDLIKQDDMIVKNAIRDNLSRLRENLERNENDISEKNPFDPMISKYEKTISLLRFFITSVSGAPSGAYNYHDRFKIDEEILKKIVEYDYEIVSQTKELMDNKILDNDVLYSKLLQLMEKFSEREKFFIPESVR